MPLCASLADRGTSPHGFGLVRPAAGAVRTAAGAARSSLVPSTGLAFGRPFDGCLPGDGLSRPALCGNCTQTDWGAFEGPPSHTPSAVARAGDELRNSHRRLEDDQSARTPNDHHLGNGVAAQESVGITEVEEHAVTFQAALDGGRAALRADHEARPKAF